MPRHTAEIIAFPSRRPTLTPEEQLAAALAKLQAALADQRAAIEQWRESIGAVREAASRLGQSVQGLHGSLGTLGAQTESLRMKALHLEALADESTIA